MNNKLNLEIGTKFGKWEITSERTETISNVTNWICKCECGHEQFVPLNNLMNGSSTQCNVCGHKESGLKRRKGFELISGDMWSQIKRKAEKKNIPFDLRIEEAWELYITQNNKCCISSLDIGLFGYPYDKEKTTATLVLINPDGVCDKNNVMWVHKDLAKMKGNLHLNEFKFLVSKIYSDA